MRPDWSPGTMSSLPAQHLVWEIEEAAGTEYLCQSHRAACLRVALWYALHTLSTSDLDKDTRIHSDAVQEKACIYIHTEGKDRAADVASCGRWWMLALRRVPCTAFFLRWGGSGKEGRKGWQGRQTAQTMGIWWRPRAIPRRPWGHGV